MNTPPSFGKDNDFMTSDSHAPQAIVMQLVDLFVQSHAPQRPGDLIQFETLMRHFLQRIDAFTRAVVAQKLAPCLHLPVSILEILVFDHDDIAEPIILAAPHLPAHIVSRLNETGTAAIRAFLDQRKDIHVNSLVGDCSTTHGPCAANQMTTLASDLAQNNQQTADDSPELETDHSMAEDKLEVMVSHTQIPDFGVALPAFFDLQTSDRCDLLARLTELSSGEPPTPAPAEKRQALIRLLSLRQYDAVAELIGDMLEFHPALGRKIIDDPSGEALVVIGRALGFEEEQFTRLVLLGNAYVGQSINRFYALRALFRQVSPQAAMRMVTVWRGSKPLPKRLAASQARRTSFGLRGTLPQARHEDASVPQALVGQK